MEIFAAIGTGIIALICFIIGWKFSNFFIPPRDYWTKSGACFAIFGVAALITVLFR
jgi:hypothetical protein